MMVQRVKNPRHAGVGIGAFVMPNHVHGIVILSGGFVDLTMGRPAVGLVTLGRAGPCRDVGAARGRPSLIGPGQARGPATSPCASLPNLAGPGPPITLDSETVDEGRGTNAEFGRPMTLGDVMHRYKTLTTRLHIDGVREAQWPPFRRRLWQRDYYEHVIRDASALRRIRTYIERNPCGCGRPQPERRCDYRQSPNRFCLDGWWSVQAPRGCWSAPSEHSAHSQDVDRGRGGEV
jgi:hypothetical protein